MDSNYWKDAYHKTWDASSKRELDMVQWIKENTGLEAEITGLGAGTNAFISGSASENGYVKGDPDLHIKETNIYIEVTGPLSRTVPVTSPLWFRPDKFENAIRNVKNGHDTFFVHHCPSANIWRVIHIDAALIERYLNHQFNITTPMIQGRREQYVEIPASDPCVKPLEFLQQYLTGISPQ